MKRFEESFRLDFIFKTFSSSVFQAILAFGFLTQIWQANSDHAEIALPVVLVIVIQGLRCLLFLLHRHSNERLLKDYPYYAFFSIATALGWGLTSYMSLMLVGVSGVGLLSLMTCAAIACATAFASAAVLDIQRVYTVIILVPSALGLALSSYPNSDWVTVGLLVFVAFYCISLSKTLNKTMLKLFEQQERIKMDLQAAREIQQSLLPKRDQQFGEFQIEVLYKPCEDLSGDFFEVQPVEDRLLFYVADVTSHGTASAQVTFLLKGIFKKILPASGAAIDLKLLTRQLAIDYSSYGLSYSVSLFMGCMNLVTGELEFVSSNFPNPVMMGFDSPQLVDTGINPVIDAMNSANDYNFKSDSLTVRKGDSLFVFTDGTYEIKGASNNGQVNYRKLFKLLVTDSQQNWKESLLSKLGEINGSQNFQDDITIMKISRDVEAV